MPMNATGVSHIAICVRDLDVSLQFYCDRLGMSIVSDVIQDTTTGGPAPRVRSPPGHPPAGAPGLRRWSQAHPDHD